MIESESEIDNYIRRYTAYLIEKNDKLSRAVEAEFYCKPVWDSFTDNYIFVSVSGRERKHVKKLLRRK